MDSPLKNFTALAKRRGPGGYASAVSVIKYFCLITPFDFLNYKKIIAALAAPTFSLF
jgi:hypothetical protein